MTTTAAIRSAPPSHPTALGSCVPCLARAMDRVAPADEVIALTPREALVAFRTFILDESASAIARALGRSVGAVEAHRTSLYVKLGLAQEGPRARCRAHRLLVAYGREIERHGCEEPR